MNYKHLIMYELLFSIGRNVIYVATAAISIGVQINKTEY